MIFLLGFLRQQTTHQRYRTALFIRPAEHQPGSAGTPPRPSTVSERVSTPRVAAKAGKVRRAYLIEPKASRRRSASCRHSGAPRPRRSSARTSRCGWSRRSCWCSCKKNDKRQRQKKALNASYITVFVSLSRPHTHSQMLGNSQEHGTLRQRTR